MKVINLANEKRSTNWRICLYAKPGTGKTFTVKFLKGSTFVLDLDNSSKVLAGENFQVAKFDRTKPIEEMSDFISKILPDASKQFDNIVIDNVSSLEKDWFIEKGRESKNGITNELQHYSMWTNYFTRLISAIYQADCNILVTAWERQRQITTETGQMFNQYAPDLRDSVLNTFMGLTDIVGRLVVKPKDNARGVILEGNDGIYAKNRLDDRKGCLVEELFDFDDNA